LNNRGKHEERYATPEAFLYFGKMSSFHLLDEFKNGAAPVNVIYSGSAISTEATGKYFGSDRISVCRRNPAANFVSNSRREPVVSRCFRIKDGNGWGTGVSP
jgi:hypothetical protein